MSRKRVLQLVLDDDDDDDKDEDKYYNVKVLLPNSTSVTLAVSNPEPEMSMKNFVNLVKQEYEKSRSTCELSGKKRKQVDWNLTAQSCFELNGEKFKGVVRFAAFNPHAWNIIRLDDGSSKDPIMYENMWDLTPDTDLLKELPQTYSFETALADLIDNSLQAVWSCPPGDRRLISVDVLEDRISVFDTGPGMDSSEKNSIDKWGKIGASLHRSYISRAIGGKLKPPYLMPYFGMFGYGGPYACMHLGRRTLVSSKTKQSKKVFTLQLNQEALIENCSTSGKNWKAYGGMRDTSEEEIKLSPHQSFTTVEIFESKCKIPDIYQLQCRLKDIYFPYIQCDEISSAGRTERPVEFQVNGEDLAEIVGGEVVTTNLNSKGHEFWFQIRFKLQGTSQEANARLKFVYFPIVRGKDSIDIILETLEEEGFDVSKSFQTFGRVSVRRLGRLLPEVPWVSIPFMERGAIATALRKCCQRVICFVDLDAGFIPTPSKTDLASQNHFSLALKNFGSKSKEKDNDVNIMIHREETNMSYGQVEQGYQEWVLEMHKTYDEEASGEDDAVLVLIVDSSNNKALCISPNCKAVRVHKVMKRKGKEWKRGQKIKILKGACGGVHKNDVYATIDYFLIEGFDDETGGDARIICRQINYSEDDGCKLSINKGVSRLDIHNSSSFPISIIDSGKCLLLDEREWNRKLEKQREKDPSRIDLLDENDCRALNFNGESTVCDSVCAGETVPEQIVAVVRPASSKKSKKLDQKHIVKMDGDMLLEVELLLGTNAKSRDKNAKNANTVYSHRSFPTSRGGFHGLYIFPLGSKFPDMFKKAGTYKFCFSVGNSITCIKKVVVSPSSTVGSWQLACNPESMRQCNISVGSSLPPCCIACFDEYDIQIQFNSVPSLEIELKAIPGFHVKIDNFEASLIDDGILKVENMVVKTDELDQIRPNYKVTLAICSKDEPFSVTVTCIVNPGPLKRVVENNPQDLGNLLPGSTVESLILEIECSTPYSRMSLTPQDSETPCSQFKVLTIRASSSSVLSSSQPALMDMVEFTEGLKEKLNSYGVQIAEADERLKVLEAEQEQAEQELSTLQASLEPLAAPFPECLSTRESMMKQIEEKHHDTAASFFCCLYRTALPPNSLLLSKKGVFGIVALLGSVASTSLSRVLSEYLGENTMLALVCKSPRFGPNSAEYRRLQSQAARLGRSITNRFHVLCLDSTRPWMDGVLENDPQRKLAIDDPKDLDGDLIPGFKGYAVNMIDLGPKELDIQTYSGHGLRETLFYGLFGDLQVYETQKHVEAALPYINGGGAVSLDGFIVKENRFIYSGCSKPEIHFPITVREDEEEMLIKLEAARDRVRMAEKKIAEKRCLLVKLEKKLKKTNEKYDNAINLVQS